jgi:transposase
VFSEQAYKREIITFEKKIIKDQSIHEKTLAQLGAQEFQCKDDAEKAAVKLTKHWKHHSLSHEIIEVKRYGKSGRPKSSDIPDNITYKVIGTVIQNEKAIELSRRRKGRFILATNDINEDKIAPVNMLSCYKEQAATEGGFRFIKGNHFNVSSVLLKNPNRVSALLVIMTLSLMVYAVAQYKLREGLKATNQTVPNQKNKEIKNPTISRVFRLFFGIQLLRIVTSDLEQSIVINLNPVRIKIIRLFGTKAMQIYGIDANNGDNITK